MIGFDTYFKVKIMLRFFNIQWRMHDIEYDSENDEYFYLGHYYSPYYSHFISKRDSAGNHIWGKAYDRSGRLNSSHNTLQYSPTYQTLYYTLHTQPNGLVKVNSTNGDIQNIYQLTGLNHDNWWKIHCSLSNDELAYF